jgi:hypothetical protein
MGGLDVVPKKENRGIDKGPVLYTYAKDVPDPKLGEKVFYIVGHSWVDGMGHAEQKSSGLGKKLKEKDANIKIIFIGKIGSSAKWAGEQIKELEGRGLMNPEQCAGVAIVTGTNDLYAGRNLESTAKTIKETQEIISSHGIPVFVFNTPCHKNDKEISEKAVRLNKKIEEKGVLGIINLHSFTEKKGYDGKHPPTKGYSEIADELLLKEAILPSLKYTDMKKRLMLQW